MAVLTYRAVELRDMVASRRWFAVEQGWHDGVLVRGEDVVIPKKPGQTFAARVDSHRVVRLHGFVLGTSETDWKSHRSALETIFDPALSPGALVVSTPYLGLSAGTRTLQCRVESTRTVDVVPMLVTEFDVVLHAIGDPPDWS